MSSKASAVRTKQLIVTSPRSRGRGRKFIGEGVQLQRRGELAWLRSFIPVLGSLEPMRGNVES